MIVARPARPRMKSQCTTVVKRQASLHEQHLVLLLVPVAWATQSAARARLEAARERWMCQRPAQDASVATERSRGATRVAGNIVVAHWSTQRFTNRESVNYWGKPKKETNKQSAPVPVVDLGTLGNAPPTLVGLLATVLVSDQYKCQYRFGSSVLAAVLAYKVLIQRLHRVLALLIRRSPNISVRISTFCPVLAPVLAACILHLAYIIHHTSYILTSYIIHLTSYILHPASYIRPSRALSLVGRALARDCCSWCSRVEPNPFRSEEHTTASGPPDGKHIGHCPPWLRRPTLIRR